MVNEKSELPPPGWMQSIENRKKRADYYFDSVLSGQLDWYSRKAGCHKSRHLLFAVAVIVLGALISVLQIYSGEAWVAGTTGALGAAVAVLRSLDTLLRPNETWQAYRKASEGMKREYRLYLNNSDAYGQAQTEEEAYRLLVERVETVIAEEQQLFWQFHARIQTAGETPADAKENPQNRQN